MVPLQRPRLLRPQPRQQRQHDVRLQPRPPGSGHQRHRLLQGQRLRRSPAQLPLRRLDQRRDIPAHQVVPLSMPDRPHQHVVRDLHRPRRPPRRHRAQRALHMRRGELCQPNRPQLLAQGLGNRVPVQRHGPRRQPIQPVRQPVIQSVTHGVPSARPQACPDLRMQLTKLVPDLGFGPPGDLLANTRTSRAESQADGADVPVLGFVPVDRVLALPATLAYGVRHRSHPTPSGSLFGSPPRLQRLRKAADQRARQDSNPRPAA